MLFFFSVCFVCVMCRIWKWGGCSNGICWLLCCCVSPHCLQLKVNFICSSRESQILFSLHKPCYFHQCNFIITWHSPINHRQYTIYSTISKQFADFCNELQSQNPTILLKFMFYSKWIKWNCLLISFLEEVMQPVSHSVCRMTGGRLSSFRQRWCTSR